MTTAGPRTDATAVGITARSETSKDPWRDVSVPVDEALVGWPDDPPFSCEPTSTIQGGDPANVTRVTMGSHTGTHIDAPRHFLPEGAAVDAMPIDLMVGPARVLGFDADVEEIDAHELRAHRIQRGDRVLFKTRNSDHAWYRGEFDPTFAHLGPDGAAYLVERHVRLVGIDYLSIGGYQKDGKKNAQVHRTLLERGVWIVEGLHLGAVAPGEVELVVAPLRLMGLDGAPARALLRPLGRPSPPSLDRHLVPQEPPT